MRVLNRFGEPIHEATFPLRPPALRFAKMLGANVARFSLLGVGLRAGQWVVTYRSRKATPWRRDPRATKGVA
jgi:hypothetical protein